MHPTSWAPPPAHLDHPRVLLLVALDLHEDLQPLQRCHRGAAPASKQGRQQGVGSKGGRQGSRSAVGSRGRPACATPRSACCPQTAGLHPHPAAASGQLGPAAAAAALPPHSHGAGDAARAEALGDLRPGQAAPLLLGSRHPGRLLLLQGVGRSGSGAPVQRQAAGGTGRRHRLGGGGGGGGVIRPPCPTWSICADPLPSSSWAAACMRAAGGPAPAARGWLVGGPRPEVVRPNSAFKRPDAACR